LTDVANSTARLVVADITNAVARSLIAAMDEAFPYQRDMKIVMDVDATSPERERAMQRLVTLVPWKIREDNSAWTVVCQRARDEERSLRDIKRDALAAGIMEVLAVLHTQQRIFLHMGTGNPLIHDDDDRNLVRPSELPLPCGYFLRWFRSEARRAATCYLIDEPYGPHADAHKVGSDLFLESLEERAMLSTLADPTNRDPLEHLLLEDEEVSRSCREALELQLIMEAATPRQRDLLLLIAEGYPQPEAARRLGMSPVTGRGQMKRLRDRVEDRLRAV
jgi:DNA-directed RNA polymerase specialized sigma24 family protein